MVRSKDVTTPQEPGPVFVVVECPDESYLDSLDTNDKLAACQTEIVQVVVHFTPVKLTRHAKYVAWMERFGADTRHLMLGAGDGDEATLRGLGSTTVHRFQYKLNLLDAEVFPLLAPDPGMERRHHGDGIATCQTLFTYHLRPKKGADGSLVPIVTPQDYIDDTMCVEGFSDCLLSLRKQLDQVTSRQTEPYPKITFLGTGSCIPSKTRNTSAILVELVPDKFLMLDCGEGTYGQLVRFFGPQRSAHVMRNLTAIFISHIHADHHIGLIGLLHGRRHSQQQQHTRGSKLGLFIPEKLEQWLSFYNKDFQQIDDQYEITFNENEKLLAGATNGVLGIDQFGLNALRTAYVEHCQGAFGVSLTTSRGFKLTYSGDTMPCDSLIEIGADCDLLIHEATMEDEMVAEAKRKRHSTTSQAINVGREMGAKFTLLTHFSQRYPKIPVFSQESSHGVGVAFDNMQVDPSRLDHLPLFIPALKLMFAHQVEEMRLKTHERQVRDEELPI